MVGSNNYKKRKSFGRGGHKGPFLGFLVRREKVAGVENTGATPRRSLIKATPGAKLRRKKLHVVGLPLSPIEKKWYAVLRMVRCATHIMAAFQDINRRRLPAHSAKVREF